MKYTPTAQYSKLIQSGELKPDSVQKLVIDRLTSLHQHLIKEEPQSILSRVFLQIKNIFALNSFLNHKGIYMYGGVGIGKTRLMDIFYNTLPSRKKMRIHFHEFMRMIHSELKVNKGIKNPLQRIAKNIAKNTKILCLDEFIVHDITDAMLISGLFDALFKLRIYLVTTSNSHPDELYKDGLQRVKFLPAISMLKNHCEIIHLETSTDYRLRELEEKGTYFHPLNNSTAKSFTHEFQTIAKGIIQKGNILTILDREIKSINSSDNIVWIDFDILCSIPRSQHDFIELAKKYTVLFLDNVPIISESETNSARYLINLVDIYYDLQACLIIRAAAPPNELYPTGKLSNEFERCISRLVEMQSKQYISKLDLS